MKNISYIIAFLLLSLYSCSDVIDLYPTSNLNTGTYYSTVDEIQAGLTGCYNGLQRSINSEWQFTELRSDNSKMGLAASTNSFNRDLSDLDMFLPAPTHQAIYTYWLNTYNNIRSANIVLDRLGADYSPSSGTINLSPITVPMADSIRRQMMGEALFIRAYHYFNLVRLYGGVFQITEPISAAEAKQINRSTVEDNYKLIIADLTSAASYLQATSFSKISAANKGKATTWAAKTLLAKVYLTQNRKSDAITLLQDVISNSGHSLQSSYANVFTTSNELNSEIIFAVRFKAGGLGLGNTWGNDFAALNSGSAIINGSGLGWNSPTFELDTAFLATDSRKAVCIATFGTGTAATLYVKKFLSPVVLTGDGEADVPVLRYSDVLLMMAEAQGFTPASITLINQVRTRTTLGNLPSSVNSIASFEQALANERRFEFAFENHRWFDLLRYSTTMPSIKIQDVIKASFAREYIRHYATYPAPILTLAQLSANLTTDKLLLPIPQRELDTNPSLGIQQNPGY